VERGRHVELIARGGLRRLYAQQFVEEVARPAPVREAIG
jgi:hypothetical protein